MKIGGKLENGSQDGNIMLNKMTVKMNIKFRRIGNARAPEINGNKISLFSNENSKLKAGHRKQIDTGLEIELPEESVGLVTSYEELSLKEGLVILQNFVEDGRLEINVANLGGESVEIEKGMKIAEMIIKKTEKINLEEKKSRDKEITSENNDLEVIKKEINNNQ